MPRFAMFCLYITLLVAAAGWVMWVVALSATLHGG